MKLLRAMMDRQEELGYLSDETLRALAKEHRVPLYRVEGLVSFYTHFRRTPAPKTSIQVCRDVACKMRHAKAVVQQLESTGAGDDTVEICEVSCLGRCDTAPALSVNDVPSQVTSIDDKQDEIQWSELEIKTFGPFDCDPYSTNEEHYGCVRKLVQESEQALADTTINELLKSNLRGMGGAGFPTGRKWSLVRDEPEPTKYVICNADESEPGTFKDRVILNELPHLVIEGMLLAGLTVGAQKGIVYIRHEYEHERKVIEAEIDRAYTSGILGENAAASGGSFDIEVFVSPGGYILGEETALLEALEDKRGEPRNKPPYPGSHGLWGKPTLINNVESFAIATCIIERGADWWNAQGKSQEFSGIKFVSVSGDVETAGVHQIPVGTTVAELIDLCGGMKNGSKFAAFLPGGASSNFLPASKVNTPLDFDSMKAAGSMLGTGAVIVISDEHDLFDLATNIVEFFRNESCGKCVPCRMGSQKAVELLHQQQLLYPEKLPELDVLPELADTMEQTSICGLGQVALNPILSLRNCGLSE